MTDMSKSNLGAGSGPVMEPEIVALARRMLDAWAVHMSAVEECDVEVTPWDDLYPHEKRGWLAAAIVARPDLAEGVLVPEGHWASGVLPTSVTLCRVTTPEGVLDQNGLPLSQVAELHGTRESDGSITWRTAEGKPLEPGERVTINPPAHGFAGEVITVRPWSDAEATPLADMHATLHALARVGVSLEANISAAEAIRNEVERRAAAEKCFHGIPMFEDCVACAEGAPR